MLWSLINTVVYLACGLSRLERIVTIAFKLGLNDQVANHACERPALIAFDLTLLCCKVGCDSLMVYPCYTVKPAFA